MEIVIRLSGVQLGPYSEQQVRQHLEEGLLTLNDLAKHDGIPDWAPLSEVLANLPATPEPPTPPETPPEDPPDNPPEAQLEPSGEVASEPGIQAPKRAPDAPPGVMHLPTRPPEFDDEPSASDVGALAKKTILLGPTAPIRSSNVGQPAPPLATTSPLISANQATKKVSRAALVKALASKTSPLPTTKSLKPPPRPTVPAPGAPPAIPPVPNKGASPALIESLTAKTVPIRATPDAPHVATPIQTTEPLPTRHIFKPASGTMPPPAPPGAPAKKEEPSIQTTEPLPTRHIFKPASGTMPPPSAPGAPPKKEELPIQTTEPLPTRHVFKPASPPTAPAPSSPPPPDLEVATVKFPPPVFKHDEKPASPVVDKPAAAPAAPASAPAAPAASAPPRRWLPKLIPAWAALAVFMLYYVWSPYHAAANLRWALEQGDAASLDAAVDFPSVRDSLKNQINATASEAGPDALALLNNSVDTYVTPAGISALVNKLVMPVTGDQSQPISSDEAAKILVAFNSQPVANEGLATFSDFVLDRGATMLHLRFTGLGWKLSRIEFRPDMTTRTASGSAAPLLSPVVDTYLEQGRAMAMDGDGKGARADFTQALTVDPQSSVAYNERATTRQALGDIDGAISDYTQALAIDPQMAAAYNGRGNARASKNDAVGAIADFTQAVHFDPTLAVAYDSRGNARIAKDDADGAIADFTQAIAIDPNLASAYSDRGFARQANGNLEGAIADYTQALALKPKTARTYFNRALARQAQGNLDAAILDFDHALAFDPKLADAYYFRGNAKSSNNDIDGAITDYTQALALNPKNAQAFNNRGLARQAKGDLDNAVADYSQALMLDPKITSAYFNRAVIEAQKNDLDDAIADSTQALYLDPKNAQAFATRGYAKLTKGNLDGALADLKQFCDLAPRDHDADHARLYLWLIAKAQNSGADADQDLSSALESSWNSAPDDLATKTASYLLGRMSESDYLAAAASPDAKIDQAQHCQAWYFTGMKRLLMGDKNGAIEAFRICVATNQKDFSEFVLAQAELQALEPAPVPKPPVAPTATSPPARVPAPPKTP